MCLHYSLSFSFYARLTARCLPRLFINDMVNLPLSQLQDSTT
ncbi:hypothetical protein PCIT_b0999 [Pseudoalteromonas citrea]|uniref:Uncharacterized protein n=1 Tax=Pseudoalteromonas citrea TaxID=43655 RepID=A0AAD4AFC8_9GAMM|nr:hypothetical protein PCIT_b0999 [Pseudoalteromonas citrea]